MALVLVKKCLTITEMLIGAISQLKQVLELVLIAVQVKKTIIITIMEELKQEHVLELKQAIIKVMAVDMVIMDKTNK
ncbi:hypothetical protein SDC9_45120 [bioreactor metagenome]|uniref:Uncharacterized protein n=1 Tax=bioreactor metagenome TaxID=1076179 RepID=A0A644W5N8_9ZZZZ